LNLIFCINSKRIKKNNIFFISRGMRINLSCFIMKFLISIEMRNDFIFFIIEFLKEIRYRLKTLILTLIFFIK